ncbi:hypothetical protein RDI58_018672 [Solanum bulbocastanum]|uniref:Bulb-type lectin domain-containing protein n=1 Tax=Solanum bulbocastanum TaxID=147425 RepID=A0AAN8YAD8_SOLBU
MTETGNLVLFDETNHTMWQSFDHPMDFGLYALGAEFSFRAEAHSKHFRSQSESRFVWFNYSQWKLGHLNRFQSTSDYYASSNDDSYFSFDGQTLTALHDPPTSPPQFTKLGHDGHLRVRSGNQLSEATNSSVLPSVLSGPSAAPLTDLLSEANPRFEL